MGEIEEDKFDELCRLCASYDAVQMDIFGEKGRERKIIEKIHTCLPFQVKERDLLPKSICYRCMYTLENFYDFRQGCVDAVNRLEKFIASSERLKLKQEYGEYNEESASASMVTDDDDVPNPADFLEACLVGESSGNQSDGKDSIIPEYECPPVDDFTCTTCGRTFNSRGALTLHSKYHTGESGDQSQLFTCHVCDKVFSSKGHLASHSKVHIGDLTERQPPDPSAPVQPRPFKCDLCEKSYSMAKHLWGHVSVSHKGDPMVTCQFCSRTYSTAANLEDHKKSKHASAISALENPTFPKLLNGFVPNDLLEVEIYLDNIKVKTEIKTEDEDDEDDDEDEDDEEESKQNEDSSNQEQTASRRKNSRPKKISRGMSGDGDEQSGDVIDDNSSEQTSFSCRLCENTFNEKNLLRDHLSEIHGIDPADVAMGQQVSESNCENEDEYVMAENMVEAETVFCCEVCVRDFNDRASLWLHMLYSHREEAATACGLCLRVCSDYVSLTEHVHNCHPKDSLKSDQRRYSCQICGRQLDSKKKLLTHVKIHNLYDNSGQIVDPESVIVMNSKCNQQNLQSILKESTEYENSIFESLKEDGHVMSCEICFKVFPNEEKLVKHKQNAHRNSQGPNSVNSSTTYHLYFSCELCGLAHSTRTERWRHVFSCHADEPSLLCEEEKCGKVFPTRALKTEHAATHHSLQGEIPNTCEVCGKLWVTRVNFWKHMMSVHSDCLPFICGVCLKIFCTVADLSAHVRDRHSPLTEGDFCCDICGRPYSNKSKMSRHRKIHVLSEAEGGLPPGHELEVSTPTSDKLSSLGPLDLLKCSLCPEEEFPTLEELSHHRRSVHNLVPCDLCPKFYGRSSHLWKHVNKIHKNHPDITCNVCFRTSASRNHLANHVAKHHRDESQNYVDISELSNEETIHTCEKCKKVFRKHVLLRKHAKHCVGPKESGLTPSPCDRCPKVFDSPVLLRKHKRSSHLLFRCEVCEDVAHDSRIELMDHIKETHPGHPDLACDFKGCDKMLRCKADLDKHKREHRLGRMPPTCGFCGELTPNKIKLRNHLKTQHSQLTKYLCAVCLVTFKDFDDLKKHVNSNHKAILTKPNVCPICARTYSNKSKVLAHIRSHGDNFFPCNKCLKVCTKDEQLKRHLEAHMEENSEEEIEEDDDEESQTLNDDNETLNDDNENTDITVATDEIKAEPKCEVVEIKQEIEETDVPDDIIDNDVEEIPSKRPRRSYTHACSACSRTFSNAGDLLNHTKQEHNELLCACGKISDNIDSHNAHAKKCVSANKAESNKKLGIIDKKTDVISKNIFNSDRKRKSDSDSLTHQIKTNYMNTVENNIPINDKSYTPRQREVRRVYKVDDGLCFCELCSKSFDAKRHLWQHLRRFHLKEAATSCGVCLKVCKDYPSLDVHLATEHRNNFEGEGKNFTCRVCGRYHNSRSKLEQHSVIHPGQQARTQAALFNCNFCSMVFNSDVVLEKHEMAEHNKEQNGTGLFLWEHMFMFSLD